MMKYVFILAFLCTTLYASIKTSGIGFDYENAGDDERAAWLETQVDLARSNLTKALHAEYGYGSPITIISMQASMGRMLTGEIAHDVADARRAATRTGRELTRVLCPKYDILPVADHDLPIQFILKDLDRRTIGRFAITRQECERYMQLAAH